MNRFFALLAAGAVTAVVYVTAAGAAPIPGATYVRGAWETPPTYLTVAGLAGLGCPFVSQDGIPEAETSQLTYPYSGWVGPVGEDLNQQVSLRTRVFGTLQDAAGNTYQVKGDFRDNGSLELGSDLLFDGYGKVKFSGPTGVVAGTAELRIVTGPLDYAFVFTSVQRCTIAS